MATIKYIVKQGLKEHLKKGVLAQGELGYNTDTQELFTGDAEGNPVKVTEVVIGPDNGLYVKTAPSTENNTYHHIYIYTK